MCLVTQTKEPGCLDSNPSLLTSWNLEQLLNSVCFSVLVCKQGDNNNFYFLEM